MVFRKLSLVIAGIGPIQRAAVDRSLKTEPSNCNVHGNYPEADFDPIVFGVA